MKMIFSSDRASSLKVFLADRSQLFRTGLKSLSKTFPLEIVGETDNSIELMKGLEDSHPDLLIVCHRLNDQEAEVFLPLVKEKFPELKILMLTFALGKKFLIQYINWIDGMMDKCSTAEEIMKAISLIVNDNLKYYVCQDDNYHDEKKKIYKWKSQK